MPTPCVGCGGPHVRGSGQRGRARRSVRLRVRHGGAPARSTTSSRARRAADRPNGPCCACGTSSRSTAAGFLLAAGAGVEILVSVRDDDGTVVRPLQANRAQGVTSDRLQRRRSGVARSVRRRGADHRLVQGKPYEPAGWPLARPRSAPAAGLCGRSARALSRLIAVSSASRPEGAGDGVPVRLSSSTALRADLERSSAPDLASKSGAPLRCSSAGDVAVRRVEDSVRVALPDVGVQALSTLDGTVDYLSAVATGGRPRRPAARRLALHGSPSQRCASPTLLVPGPPRHGPL